MERSVFDITLEMQSDYSTAEVTVNRGDTHRTLRLHLTDGGRPYPLEEDVRAVLTAAKPDGTHLYNACRVEAGVVLYDLTPQTTVLPGQVACQLRLYGGKGELLSTAAFLLTVADTVYDDGDESIQSAQEMTALTKLFLQVDEKLDQMEEALKNEANHAVIDDTKVGVDAWSSKNTADRLCHAFTAKGMVAVCEPLEGYPLEIVSTINIKGDRSAWDSITLTRCGKNLFDIATYPFTKSHYINHTNGALTGGNYPYAATVRYIPVSHLRGMNITLNSTPGGNLPGLAFYDADKVYISGKKGGTVVVPNTASYMRFTVSDVFADDGTVQIEIGSTATPYEEYKGVTPLTADLSNSPLPIFEGSYNWTTGVLMDDAGTRFQHNLDTNTFINIEDEVDSERYIQPIVRKIPALPGVNYLYSDCGNTEVKGKADPVKIIDKLTNAILALGGNV